MFFDVRTAVNITIALINAWRYFRQSTALKISAIVWVLAYKYGLPDMPDNNIWLVFYIFDVAVVVSSAIAAGYLGFSGFFAVTMFCSLLFTVVWALQFSRFIFDREVSLIEFGPLSKFPGLDTGLVLYIDYVSYSFALLTSLISLCVYAYAFSYMRFEKNILNFLVYFKLFGWSMILLVMAGSWFTLLLGWELIGVTSFLLINFWVSKITTLKSAFKAFVFNKVSDAALIAALCLNLSIGISYINTSAVFTAYVSSAYLTYGNFSVSYATVLLVLLCVAGFCKSAQFGLHFWLPDSMEAPVPASALIHSATLVSAGIYLLLRFNGLFLYCKNTAIVFAVITSFTAFYGAVIASYQTDVKKILAYSTISHCGMLMFSILMQSPFITIFYLFAHGFFKSINFMCVGNFIQSSNNYQDVSRMGRFFGMFRFEFYFFIITLFNLSSGPLFFCFFSKHWLVGFAYTNGFMSSVSVCFIYATAFCGIFYSSKLLFECALSHKRAHSSVYATHRLDDIDSAYRRSNGLGRFAMSALFVIAFITLYALWTAASSSVTALVDDYASVANVQVMYTFYAAHIWFSFALVLIGCTYVLFKSRASRFNGIIPLFITISSISLFL